MALLHGTGGTTGRRSRIDRSRAPESESEVLRSLLPRSADELVLEPADLRVDRGLSINRDDRDAEARQNAAALEAALLRLAAAGPTLGDVLVVLVHEAATLLQAPARVALALDGRLVWTTSSDSAGTPIGADVDVEATACGEAWRTGLIQNVGRPPAATINLDPAEMAAEQGVRLSTKCCGSPAVVLAVPLLREGPTVPGRHAGFTREVFAVLALLGERPNWFDDDDIEASADLAEVAGERIAALVLLQDELEEPGAPEAGSAEVGATEVGSAEVRVAEVGSAEVRVAEAGSVDTRSAEARPPEVRVAAAGSVDIAPIAMGSGRIEAEPEALPAGVQTANFEWPPFLVPSAGAMPVATKSITVVPTARSGRGFGGWFTRAPKNPSQPVIPGPRTEPAFADMAPSVEIEADEEPFTPILSSGSGDGATSVGKALPRRPVQPKRFPAEPAQGGSSGSTQTPSVQNETALTEPSPADSVQPDAPRGDSIHNEDGPEPASVSLAPSKIPGEIPGETLTETGNGFGPRSRVSRLRSRGAAGSAMPPAMPAADSMGLWQWDALTGKCTWSSPVARLLGLAPDAELTLAVVREAVAPADRGRFDVAVQAIGTGRGVAGAVRLKTADGRAKHAYAWSEVRRDETGRLLGAWGGVVDVTAFEHDAAALRSGLAGLRAAQELTGLATWEWRADRRQLTWSDEMYRLAGVPAETFEPTPERWHAFVHPDDLERAQRLDLGADLDSTSGADGERVETFRLIGPGGEIRHVQSWSATSSDRVVYGATIDVTRQVHDRMTLERLSATDPVTGLGNRLAFDRRMQQLLGGAGGARTPGRRVAPAPSVTLILLDLDRFKVVNDSLGHQVGDRLLIEVARRLVAVVPNGSVTVRMGGDEFVVVPPPGVDEPEVRRLAGSIVEAMRAPYVLPETGELLICPASLGIAISERRRVTGHDLLREADIALYRAKDAGRDRFVIFDEALKARTLTRQRAERRLRSALEDDRLMMQYQPVVDFSNGRVIGAEGLVRLRDAEDDSVDRLIPPELFLDIAEQTGLVVEIDCWVIETAIEQLAAWAEPGEPGPWLAINLSARSMEHPRVIRRLIEAVKRGDVDRDRIKIELTEQSFIGSLPGVDAGVRQLIANGIGVGIDDFGTGYSALAYLQHFDLDFMKIDRSFVSSVGEGPRGDAVVTAIVDLAHAHGMRVIAEGVESGRQSRRLREIGCDFAQGFHFGRPGEADRIVRG